MPYTAQEVIDIYRDAIDLQAKKDPNFLNMLELEYYSRFPSEVRPTERVNVLIAKLNGDKQ